MRVSIEGKLPKAVGLSRSELKAAAAFFAARSSARIGVAFREVTVILQDDAASDEAHRAIMDVAGATDVITQGYEAIPPEPEGIYGELYVNCDQALRVAPKRKGWSPAKELLLYVAHGMDHLSGADDHSPEDYTKMRRRELKWLREWKETKGERGHGARVGSGVRAGERREGREGGVREMRGESARDARGAGGRDLRGKRDKR